MNFQVLAGATAGQGGWQGTLVLVAYIAIILVAFYFILIRPQKKKQKEEKKMRDSIQIGDEIITIGGFYYKIVSIKEDSFIVESPVDHTKMRLAKWAVQSNNTLHD